MTDEERLEDIKKIISMWHSNIRDGDINTVTLDDIEELEWLIKQAEKVERFNKDKKALEEMIEATKKSLDYERKHSALLGKENRRLRESFCYIVIYPEWNYEAAEMSLMSSLNIKELKKIDVVDKEGKVKV